MESKYIIKIIITPLLGGCLSAEITRSLLVRSLDGYAIQYAHFRSTV